jgi:hypothetical protein
MNPPLFPPVVHGDSCWFSQAAAIGGNCRESPADDGHERFSLLSAKTGVSTTLL